MATPRLHTVSSAIVRAALIASGLVVAAARAREPELPVDVPSDGVFVAAGVTDTFEATRVAVARARESSHRTYHVVVVDRVGEAGDARSLLDQILERWQERDPRERRGYDPAADVTILLATKDRGLAMDVPRAMKDESGLDSVTIAADLIQSAFVPRAEDGLYDQGLAALVDETEAWVKRRAEEKQARAEAARRFRTRTLPLGLAGIAGTVALTALGLQRLRHVRRLEAARDKLAAFKADVVALSDLLDAQQERHRMLPHADADFRTPMEGLTRSTYDGVQGAIARYRERWLGLMDVWERAQAKVDAEWFMGTAAAGEALALLESAEARPPLDEVAGACRGPLDQLETAHEKARDLLATLDSARAAADKRLDELASRGRSNAPFQAPLGTLARGREHAAAIVERDPVAARGALEELAASLAATLEHVAAVEAADDRRRVAFERAASLATEVAGRRADGWLLAEPGANPDDRLAEARHECGLAAQLLDSGDAAGAGTCLERAERACGEAAALLESVVAARARVDELTAPAITRLEALAAARGTAHEAVEHLARSYADRSWADVADNVARVDESLDRARRLLVEARTAAEPQRQHYFRAVALVEEAIRHEDWVAGCQDAVAERRATLDGLRSTLPGRRAAVADHVAGLARQLERQHTDRARANERCREAARILEVAESALEESRPDLLEAQRLLSAADEAAARAAELAAEDERLAHQAANDLEETATVVRRVAAWYDEGVQPDVHSATVMLESAGALLGRQRYEDAIRMAGDASLSARAAYAAASAEADRRRHQRQQEIQRRRLEDSFQRSARGSGPWVITLPGGQFSGPSPWQSMQPHAAPTRSAGAGWSRDIAQVNW